MACCGPTPPKKEQNEFTPDYYAGDLTLKFYARHDNVPQGITDRVLHYENEIQKLRDYNPRDYYCTPRYTSQSYGWLPGDELLRLQNCSIDHNPLVLELLREYFASRPKKMQRLPEAALYCRCPMARLNDHWKIV